MGADEFNNGYLAKTVPPVLKEEAAIWPSVSQPFRIIVCRIIAGKRWLKAFLDILGGKDLIYSLPREMIIGKKADDIFPVVVSEKANPTKSGQ